MIRQLRVLFLALPLLSLAACGEGAYSDLDQFIKDSGKDLRGKIDPLPEVKPYEHYAYNAFDIADPFKPRKADPVKSGGGGGIQPDLNRHKEALESFPLESLKMVGTLQQNRAIFALVRAPDSTLHKVKAGAYMGQNFGLITEVSESEVKLKEIVQDSIGDWAERISTLLLEDQEKK